MSLYAYINPIIAVALGVLLLASRSTCGWPLAAALVLAGVGDREMRNRAGTAASGRNRRVSVSYATVG